VKILLDLPALTGIDRPVSIGQLVQLAWEGLRNTSVEELQHTLAPFFDERIQHVLRVRGAAQDEIKAVTSVVDGPSLDAMKPASQWAKAAALKQVRGSQEFMALAELFKRVKNISKGVKFAGGWHELATYAAESPDASERDLVAQVEARRDEIRRAEGKGDYVDAFKRISTLRPYVAKYFDDVMVMADDPRTRDMRLQLMAALRDLVWEIADISEITTDGTQA
jgi:glycyl-tRNA synthetase beta chain